MVTGRYHAALEAAARAVIVAAVTEARGNRTRAAEALGIGRSYLVRRVRELELQRLVPPPPRGGHRG